MVNIMKNIFNLFKSEKKTYALTVSSEFLDEKETTDINLVKQYKQEISDIKIENQPFRISGLLHILTNKLTPCLKENAHTIYYDVDKGVGRYIVGDNDYLEQVLSILLNHACLLNRNAEIVLKISKIKNDFLLFDIVNEKSFIDKKAYQQYNNAFQVMSTQSQQLNNFVKAKMIVDAMQGKLEVTSNKRSGTLYTFKIPYYEDENDKNHQEELKKILNGKKALFIGRDKYDTQRTQYIFETYGMYMHNLKLDDFEKKKPDLSRYDMAIIRSTDLSYKHISFFKNIAQDTTSNFKMIIVHELFEEEEKIKLSKPIADAELYSPIIIGDVEEILYQIFILKSKAVKGINNIEIFNTEKFIVKGDYTYEDNNLEYFRGANIAIVEDSKVDEKILQNILNQEGITLFCMNNGLEMLELLEREEIDIIFTDINMPIMDGILMTKKIRTMEKFKTLPIISISSMAFTHELKKMELAGMNAAITKPIDVNDVHMALKNFLIMTEKIRMRTKNRNQISFSFNKDVLDVSKGVEHSGGNLKYYEKLLQIIDELKDSRESFENMIHAEEFVALGKYARDTLDKYEVIYASEMVKMFKDLMYFISQRQRTHLVNYIDIYKKNWEELEAEVEKYTNSM